MEDFNINAFVGFWVGCLFGIFIVIVLYCLQKEEIKISGSYLNYENVLYKKVSEEELDNIIIIKE